MFLTQFSLVCLLASAGHFVAEKSQTTEINGVAHHN